MLLAVLLTFYIVVLIFVLALCKAAGRDKYKNQWIEQRKKEEFKGFFFCDDDCYMCNDQGRCQRSAMREVKHEYNTKATKI